MTEAMPFLRKCDITFLRPPPFRPGGFCCADNDLRTKIQQSEHLSLYGQGAAGV